MTKTASPTTTFVIYYFANDLELEETVIKPDDLPNFVTHAQHCTSPSIALPVYRLFQHILSQY